MNADAAPIIQAEDRAPIGFAEFVTLVAALMALTSLGIDSMLPALPAIGDALGVARENERQLVITLFLVGFGIGQLIHGPLADRYGRRPVLAWSLGLYALANIAAAAARSFELLLAARLIGGAAIAANRVVTVALVRDCFSGRAMARVMSIAFIVFMAAPVLAPSVGTLVLLVGDWRTIFWLIAGTSLAILGWFLWRMPETQHPDDRLSLSPARIAQGWRLTVRDRLSLGYTIAFTALLGALYGYLNSIQQVLADIFHHGRLLAIIFAGTAATMAVANLLNARIVMRLGTRRISHSAVAIMTLLAAANLALALSGYETLVAFAVMQALTMGCFGLSTSNFSAMAMENMGHIAGTASSVQGFVSVTAGALIGLAIGQAFNGTTVPLHAGFMLAGLVAIAAAAVTERGRLFRSA